MKPPLLFVALLATVSVSGGTLCAQTLPASSSQSEPSRPDAVVSTDKDARFKTIQEAIDAAPDNATRPHVILIKPGRYRWQQTLIPKSKPFIHLVGEDADTTIISYHLNVNETVKDRQLKGFEGIGVIVQSDDSQASNLTFENTSGDHGQALALRIDGNRAIVRNCRLLGWQDTLMVNNGRHYFRDCYIEGRVDFIYGSATAVFDRCTIHSKAGGYITAANTPQTQPFGFVFLRCTLTGDNRSWEPEMKARPAELGRPWRPFAAVAFVECEMGAHIKATGWNNWRNPENEKTARFSEYKSTGPGANPDARVSWSRQLTDAEAAAYTVRNILGSTDGWNPSSR